MPIETTPPMSGLSCSGGSDATLPAQDARQSLRPLKVCTREPLACSLLIMRMVAGYAFRFHGGVGATDRSPVDPAGFPVRVFGACLVVPGGFPSGSRRILRWQGYRDRVDELADSGGLAGDPAALRARLAADGYVFLRGLLPAEQVRAAGELVAAKLRAGGWTAAGPPGPGALVGTSPRGPGPAAARRTGRSSPAPIMALHSRPRLATLAAPARASSLSPDHPDASEDLR